MTPPVPSPWLAVGDNRLEQSVRELWDLSRNSRLGELAGQIEFVEPVALSADEPLIAGFIPTGMLVEVWSLAEGQMVGRLACQDIASVCAALHRFHRTRDIVAGVSAGHRPSGTAWCVRFWNFVHGEMLAEFVPVGHNWGSKNSMGAQPRAQVSRHRG